MMKLVRSGLGAAASTIAWVGALTQLSGCTADVSSGARSELPTEPAPGGRGREGGASPGGGAAGRPHEGGDGGADDAADGAPGEAPCTKVPKTYGSLGMWECVPTGMATKTSEPAGLVVAMHGYTQGVVQQGSPNAEWGFKATSQWAVLAERYHFYVIYPDKGASAFQWYSFYGTSGIGRSDLEPKAIVEMVDDMRAKYNIDPNKIFLNGLSAGAFMTVVMLATYPDVFAAGSTFEGGAYGCSSSCAALGKKGKGWSWPGNHASSLVVNAYPTVWKDASARKPRLMIFQGDADGAVTPENLADLTAQWKGAVGVTGAGTKSALKGHDYTEYTKNGEVAVATVLMKGIGHGTPVDPGSAPDQGGWDPNPSQTASADPNAVQDWTNTTGIYGPYYSAKFFGLVP